MINPELKIIESIVNTVAYYYKLDREAIFAVNRKGQIIKARQIIHYLLRKNTKKSWDSIGKVSLLYGRPTQHDHASAYHSWKSITNLIETDKGIRNEVEEIQVLFLKQKKVLTTDEVEKVDKFEVVLYYEEMIKGLESLITEQENQIQKLKENFTKNITNESLKKLMLMDRVSIDLFCKTRLEPFLKMRNADLERINKYKTVKSLVD